MKRNSKYKKIKAIKAYSILEIIVALFIFSVIVLVVSQVFATAFSTYATARETQRDTESLQQSMNLLTKTLRTSTIISCTQDLGGALDLLNDTTSTEYLCQTLIAYDYSQGACIQYQMSSTGLSTATASSNTPVTKPSDCKRTDIVFPSLSNVSPVLLDTEKSFFRVKPSLASSTVNIADTTDRVGRVTIILAIANNDKSHTGGFTFQTTVSLRDYPYTGIIR